MESIRPEPVVLVYSSQLLPYSETFIKSQCLALEGWQPVLIGERILENGLALDGLQTLTLLPVKAKRWQRIAYRMARRVAQPLPGVLARLRAVGARLIHAHFGPSAVEIWPYAKALGLPMLVTLHGYDINTNRTWWEGGHGGRRLRNYPARLLQLAREPNVHFIAVSEAIAKRAVEYGIAREKIRVHYIGVDTTLFAPPEVPLIKRGRRVLFVGRLVEKKGARYLLEAFARVQTRVPDAELLLAGDGPLRPQLERQAADLGLRACFAGALPGPAIRQEMAEARVLSLPSVTAENGDAEGLGLVLLEAQAAGLPVVSSARGGANEAILHGLTGFSHAERDVRAIEENIVAVLSDDALFERLSAQGVEYARREFDLKLQTAKLSTIYAECVYAKKNGHETIS